MSALSLPLEKPVPLKPIYPISELYLFQPYDFASYQKAFGLNPPEADFTFRPKNWFDNSVADKPVDDEITYRIFKRAQDGSVYLSTVTMSNYEAAHINIFPPAQNSDTVDPVLAKARSKPAREIPIRALVAGEVIIATPFAIEVHNQNFQRIKDEQEGKFTADDREKLNAIYKLMTESYSA